MPIFLKLDKCYKNSCWYFLDLQKMKFDKEYFPRGLERSKRISKIQRRKYENAAGEGLLLAQEKSVCIV